MNAQELAKLLLDRVGDSGLEWEVLWNMFAVIMQDYGVSEEQMERALHESLREWDV